MDDNKLFNNTETETFKYATTAEKRNQEKYLDEDDITLLSFWSKEKNG